METVFGEDSLRQFLSFEQRESVCWLNSLLSKLYSNGQSVGNEKDKPILTISFQTIFCDSKKDGEAGVFVQRNTFESAPETEATERVTRPRSKENSPTKRETKEAGHSKCAEILSQ